MKYYKCHILALAFLLSSLMGWLFSAEPEPYRGDDEIEGRDFDYNSESFIHRFTFRFRPAESEKWETSRQGFRGTVGSTRSDEFYVFLQAQKDIEFEKGYFFSYRFKRDEDFDSQYDRNLIGLGTRLSRGWSVGAFADLEAKKENMDLQFELTQGNLQDNYFRLVFVATDFSFNDKQNQAEDIRQPFTYFGEYLWHQTNGAHGQIFLNYNTRLKREDRGENFDFSYEQLQGGFEYHFPLTTELTGSLKTKGELGERRRFGITSAQKADYHLKRYHSEVTFELTHQTKQDLAHWLGYRYFSLKERDERLLDPSLDRRFQHQEHMLYGGVSWQIDDSVLFWPGLYVSLLDNFERFPSNSPLNDEGDDWVGKIALPFEFDLGREATLTVNPTIEVHQFAFGGGNVQARIPF